MNTYILKKVLSFFKSLTNLLIIPFFLTFAFIPFKAIAALDPVSWSLNKVFPVDIQTGINYSVVYTLKSNLPTKMLKPLVINKESSSTNEFTYIDTCSGAKLNPKQTCTVTVTLTPAQPGVKSFQLVIAGYSDDKVPLPKLVTNAIGIERNGVTGVATLELPTNMSQGVGQNYTFTFTNNGATSATHVTPLVTQTSGTQNITSNTCATLIDGTLIQNGICTISGSFIPTAFGAQSVTAQLTFDGSSGSPAIATTDTTVSVPDALIVASLVEPDSLPPLMVKTSTYTVKFLFSNVSSGSVDITIPPTVTCQASDASDCSAMIETPFYSNTCVNTTLNLTQNCDVTAVFNPSNATDGVTYTVRGSLEYTGLGHPATTTTSGTVVAALPTARTIQVVNQCNFDVWYSLTGGSTGFACSDSVACPGAGVNSTCVGNVCYWNNYRDAGLASNQLTASGGTAYVTVPVPTDSRLVSAGTQWSGVVSASLNCDGTSSCAQAGCNNAGGSTSCAAGKGFSQPATQAEITMLLDSIDSYDVEVINGMHVPISMQAAYLINSSDSSQTVLATQNNYTCGTPGAYFTGNLTENGFGSCDFSAVSLTSAQTPYYYMVDGDGSETCTPSTTCTTGKICGLNSSLTQSCGSFLGYWTPNEVCTQSSVPAAISSYFQCTSPTGYDFAAAKYNNTFTDLMACSVAKTYTGPTYSTCYKTTYPANSNVDQCCGCVNWWDTNETHGEVILVNQTAPAVSCPTNQTSQIWTTDIQPGVQWLKKACPSDYTFPFDDVTSSFTCTNNSLGGANSTSYIITFCPSGNTGLPTGANEGR
jgi:hypothetical protein